MFGVSQYKFFGCHVGALYSRYDLLNRFQAYKARLAEYVPPHKFETGTKNHEGLAGTAVAINYLADIGAEFGAPFAGFMTWLGYNTLLITAERLLQVYSRCDTISVGLRGHTAPDCVCPLWNYI